MAASFPGLLLLSATISAYAVPAASVNDVAWLAGCWASTDADVGSGEQWMAPGGGTMLGMGRQVRGGRTVGYEWMRIIDTVEGSLAYLALPAGQAETRFALVELGDGEVRFDNPDHDFPQLISYRLEADRLHARIEGRLDGQAQAVDFSMRRVACPG